MDDQVETIGEILKDVIEVVKEENEDMEIESMDDLIEPENYIIIQKAFEKKVCESIKQKSIVSSKNFATQVRELDTIMYNLRRTEFFRGIENAVEKIQETVPNINEAEDIVWDQRKNALKYILKNNAELMDEYLFPEEDEED